MGEFQVEQIPCREGVLVGVDKKGLMKKRNPVRDLPADAR